jgi:hypothetical protein
MTIIKAGSPASARLAYKFLLEERSESVEFRHQRPAETAQ